MVQLSNFFFLNKEGVKSQAQNLRLKQGLNQHLPRHQSYFLSLLSLNYKTFSCFNIDKSTFLKNTILRRCIRICKRETSAPRKELDNYLLDAGTKTHVRRRTHTHVAEQVTSASRLTPPDTQLCAHGEELRMLFEANNLPADLWCSPFQICLCVSVTAWIS